MNTPRINQVEICAPHNRQFSAMAPIQQLATELSQLELPRTQSAAGQWLIGAGALLAIGGIVLTIAGVAEIMLDDDT